MESMSIRRADVWLCSNEVLCRYTWGKPWGASGNYSHATREFLEVNSVGRQGQCVNAYPSLSAQSLARVIR